MKVRLKMPHGVQNPSGFDREKWLFTERISATGYIVAHPSNRCDAPAVRWSINRVRQFIASSIRLALPAAADHGIVLALAVAERRGLSDLQWDVLRVTGTAHLLAISGLHISLVAALAFFSRTG